jgi:MFS family permease
MGDAVFFNAQFQQIALGQGSLDAGLRLLPWGIPPLLIASRAGALSDRIGPRPLILTGMLLAAIGMAWLALIAAPGVAYAAMIAPMTVAGAGLAIAIPATAKSVVSAAAPADIGKASGAYSSVRQLGGAFGVAILVAVFAGAGSYASPHSFSNGYASAMAAAAALALLGALTGTALPRSRRRVRPAVTGAARSSAPHGGRTSRRLGPRRRAPYGG